jgi:predicted oxidoreductase
VSTTLVDPTPRLLGEGSPDALTVGPLGFGTWRFVHDDPAAAQRLLEAALDAGMSLVDTADVYGLDWGGTGFGAVESLLGRVLRSAPHLRHRMVLATKGGIRPPVPYDSSPAALCAACEASLDRLGVEVIDLYQVHRPDLLAHPHDVAGALVELQRQGKVRLLGVSNHTPAQTAALRQALAEAGAALATTQPELSVAELGPVRDGTLDDAMAQGTAPLAWSPLAGGRVVSGEGLRPELVAVLDELAEREGVDRPTVAIAFVLALPSRPVAILGSQHPDRIAVATAALTVHLDRTDAYRIIQASEGVPLP